MVKVRQLQNNQFIITIPKAIAKAMRLQSGDHLDFIFDRGEVFLRKT